MVTYRSILVWKIPWTKEPNGLESMELQRVKHNGEHTHTHTHTHTRTFINSLLIIPHLLDTWVNYTSGSSD